MTDTTEPNAPSLEVVPYPQQAPNACRTTRQCADHGFCRRCQPEFSAVMSRVNTAIQRTDSDEQHWGPLYAAVAEALRGTHAAASAVVPAADRAALRDRTAEALWQTAEHDIVAEWICCEPIDPSHTLCVQGGAAMRMIKSLIFDGDRTLADAALAVLPVPEDRAAVLEAADWFDRDGRSVSRFWGHQVAAELRRLAVESAAVDRGAAETPPAEGEAHPPTTTWKVESPRRDTWASWGATYDERDWAQERYESATANAPARPFRLVRATTTYTVEAEHTPVVEAQPGKDTETRVVGYRSNDGRLLYCTGHAGELFGLGYTAVTADDLPDGGICTHPDCGVDVLIPQQPKEAKPTVGYSGKGRLWCLTCPRPDGEDLPVTIAVVRDGELCAGCGRDVIDLARATEERPTSPQ